MILTRRFLAIVALLFFTPQFGFAQNPSLTELGIDEKLGQDVPLDLVFFNVEDDSVLLGDLIDTPAIISLVYYNCPGICTPAAQWSRGCPGKI